jgi:hypothetical protein
LRPRNPRDGREGGSARCQMEKSTARKFDHIASPNIACTGNARHADTVVTSAAD